ncbi:phage tail protein [bacterium]|nr:phage tail protein [bacterium]
MAEPFLGEIRLFPYNFAPKNWVECAGQLLAIGENQALYSLLGTMYGGNGRTDFGMPDLRGRVPISYGQGPGLPSYPMAHTGGSYALQLNIGNMPEHSHTASAQTTVVPQSAGSAKIKGANDPADKDQVEGNYLASTSGTNLYRTSSRDFKEMAAGAIELTDPTFTASTDVTINNTGGGNIADNMQPYLAMRYCIATEGLYPQRS